MDCFGGENVRQFASFKKLAERKLVMLDSAVTLGGLAASLGNKLEKLLGDRAGQYSIRINGQGGFVLLGKMTVRMTSKLWTIIKEYQNEEEWNATGAAG